VPVGHVVCFERAQKYEINNRSTLGSRFWMSILASVPQAAFAQSQLPGAPAPANPQQNAPINAAKDVSLDQKLETQVSLNNLFRDESGKTIPLSNYFGNKPVILVLPFYKCPGVCTAELDGMVKRSRMSGSSLR
jgi:protein SCO1/2